jgi:hypothetical protein
VTTTKRKVGQGVQVPAYWHSRGGWNDRADLTAQERQRARDQEAEGGPRAGGGVANTGVKRPALCTGAE